MSKQSQGTDSLAADSELFFQYLELLDKIIESPEIEDTLSDLNISKNRLRMMSLASSDELLREAPAEYEIYKQSLIAYQNTVQGSKLYDFAIGTRGRLVRSLSIALIIAGIAFFAAGLMTPWWPVFAAFSRPSVWMLAVGTLTYIALLIITNESAVRVFSPQRDADAAKALSSARNSLIAVVSRTYLLAHVRTLINQNRRSALGNEFAVVASPGLSSANDTAYQVPTENAMAINVLLDRLDGASIGVAGPRGSGKSTLIRDYCEDDGIGSADLRCMVMAPVEYAPREFILNLYAKFCQSVQVQINRRQSPLWQALTEFGPRFANDALPPFAVALVLIIFKNEIAEFTHNAIEPEILAHVGVGTLAYMWLSVARAALYPRLGTSSVYQFLNVTLSVLITVIFWGFAGFGILYFQNKITIATNIPAEVVNFCAYAALAIGVVRALVNPIRRFQESTMDTNVIARHLIVMARQHLRRIRYLQTQSVAWSSGLHLKFGIDGQRNRTISRVEQPMTYPEIVDEFRSFVEQIAEFLYENKRRIFIGVDELDKIGSSTQAEHFLNEIKGVFGIPHTYFLVSISDDALMSFERRGLPLRDAFDSAFDEVVRVDPLTYAESRRVIYRRVIGLTEPYIAFCHCLSGGLARELLRVTRRLVHAGQDTASDRRNSFGEICAKLIWVEIRNKLVAAAQAIRSSEGAEPDEALLDKLFSTGKGISTETSSPANLIEEIRIASGDESPELGRIYQDLAAYLYFCLTLQEVFVGKVDTTTLVRATAAEDSRHAGHFDTLAAARLALSFDTSVAWRMITTFRSAWALTEIEPFSRRK